jgi:hypothetical protein
VGSGEDSEPRQQVRSGSDRWTRLQFQAFSQLDGVLTQPLIPPDTLGLIQQQARVGVTASRSELFGKTVDLRVASEVGTSVLDAAVTTNPLTPADAVSVTLAGLTGAAQRVSRAPLGVATVALRVGPRMELLDEARVLGLVHVITYLIHRL